MDQSIFRAIDEEKVKELEERIQNFKKVFYYLSYNIIHLIIYIF